LLYVSQPSLSVSSSASSPAFEGLQAAHNIHQKCMQRNSRPRRLLNCYIAIYPN
jgi:hypothetical protein